REHEGHGEDAAAAGLAETASGGTLRKSYYLKTDNIPISSS
ncbi:hypothetical protein CapIbe_024259, partial [Capra ibex]